VDALLCLPANWRKDRKLRHLDIAAAAKAAGDRGLPRQSAESIRKKIRLISALFADANERHGGVSITFPTKGLPKRVRANEQRDPFTEVELSRLLASNIPGHLNWLTWLGLYTGARLNELAQLTTNHIHNHGDLYYIKFDRDLRLKSGSCVRSVPIHKKLVEQGFLGYVSKQSSLLFPGITQHSSGRFSDALSKAFGRHLRAIGLKRRKLSFHSLRHTFAERFKVAAPSEVETRERLLGHAVTGVAGRYGGDYLAEASDMKLLAHRASIMDGIKF
jgi:integrase